MLDPEFKLFYDDVRDPLWPDVNEYSEFIKLPSSIQKECFHLHGLESKIQQFCDPSGYSTIWIFRHQNLAFVPITKCASTYYSTEFSNHGWTYENISLDDAEQLHLFGVIRHPLERYLKGLAEQFYFSHRKEELPPERKLRWWEMPHDIDLEEVEKSKKSQSFLNLLLSINVGDAHTCPYHLEFGNLLHKINWIPLDIFTDNEVKSNLISFCNSHIKDISLSFDQSRLHQSSPSKIEIYNLVKQNFFQSKSKIYEFYRFYGTDLKFFYQLLDKFSGRTI